MMIKTSQWKTMNNSAHFLCCFFLPSWQTICFYYVWTRILGVLWTVFSTSSVPALFGMNTSLASLAKIQWLISKLIYPLLGLSGMPFLKSSTILNKYHIKKMTQLFIKRLLKSQLKNAENPWLRYSFLFLFVFNVLRLHSGVVVNLTAEGSLFESWLGPFREEYAHSPHACMDSLLFGYSGFLPSSNTTHIRLMGDSHLTIWVSVSVYEQSSLGGPMTCPGCSLSLVI